MSNSLMLPRINISDTPDATKTAAGCWAASPAALASVVTSLSSLICDFSIGDNSAHFKCKLNINDLTISNIVISKSGDIFTVDITYSRSSIWGELFVIPSRNVLSIG